MNRLLSQFAGGGFLCLIMFSFLTACHYQKPGETRWGSRHLQQYAWSPPGSFEMGCSVGDSQCDPVEKPARAILIPSGFWIGQTEVTVEAYQRFTQMTKGKMPLEPKWKDRLLNQGWRDRQQPIVNVTWNEAEAFCNWVGGRLPTESEWEYASRAGATSARYGDLTSIAWYADNSGDHPFDGEAIVKTSPDEFGDLLYESGAHPHEVGKKTPNRWGLYDTLGNVWEWTASAFPQAGEGKPTQMLRGGAWSFGARLNRVSVKGSAPRQHRSTSIGFRCIISSPEMAGGLHSAR